MLLLVVFIFSAYLPVHRAGYIWDDYEAVVANPLIQSTDGLLKLWFKPKEHPNEEHYWPLTYTTFWIERRLWGESPLASHLINVALHTINALILWQILKLLKIPGAWFAAAIFALHPVRVESVAWIIERKDLLSALFYFISFFTYWRWLEKSHPKWLILSIFSFVLGLLSKSIVVTLPVAMALCLWWKNSRLTVRHLTSLIPYFILGILFSVGDLILVRQKSEYFFNLSVVERLVIAGRALWHYLWKWFVPLNLSAVYPQWSTANLTFKDFLYPLSFFILFVSLWVLRHKIRLAPLVALLYFTITLSPVLCFIDYSYMEQSYV
ncbi:MAG: glycosyltransferase family 39 protein, partial [Candidatus Sumerlaeia bacterium]|nr:glycosyltransferase family 39 protein [Candidatus Sumerlaeia bacterium]